jgi:putative membrane protein
MKLVAIVVAGLLVVSVAVASAQAITDAQIAHIVVTANQVDIDAGTLAASKGSNAEVKKFGQQMVTDHTGVNKQASELAAKLKVTPADNPTSQSLKALLVKVRPAFVAHLEHAKMVQASLGR